MESVHYWNYKELKKAEAFRGTLLVTQPPTIDLSRIFPNAPALSVATTLP